ncbi:MAG: hypothetical protein LBG44_01220 [Gemmatimonadota bacterium]|nr:hypothetical protein [Gemmatimonadota bacterium]
MALLLTACGGDSSTGVSSTGLAAGVWQGTFTNNTPAGENGTITLDLRQNSAGLVTGTATLHVPTLPSGITGAVTGVILYYGTFPAEAALSITTGGDCPANLPMTGTLSSASLMELSIVGNSSACSNVRVSGAVALSRK